MWSSPGGGCRGPKASCLRPPCRRRTGNRVAKSYGERAPHGNRPIPHGHFAPESISDRRASVSRMIEALGPKLARVRQALAALPDVAPRVVLEAGQAFHDV